MTGRRSGALAALALAIPLAAAAIPCLAAHAGTPDFPSGHYVLDHKHASLIARVKHMDVSLYTLRFDTLDASFDYDAARPEATRLTASVDPASLDVNADYAKEFEEKFLSASKFPKATFVATSMQKTADGQGITVESRHYHKPGQALVDPNTGLATVNLFESSARLQVVRTDVSGK